MKPGAYLSLLLLSACGGGGGSSGDTSGTTNATASVPPPVVTTPPPTPAPTVVVNDIVDCAPAGAAGFTHVCTVEHRDSAQGRLLVLRAPDGGFRRLLVTSDGSGVAEADGAEPAKVTILSSSLIEVAIGNDRYRLPASVRQ